MFFWSRSDDSSCGSPVGSNHSDQSHPSSLIIHTQPLLTGCFSFFLLFHILMSDWIIAQVDGECIRTADEGFCPKCAVSLETLDFTTSYTSVHRLELKLCPPSISTGATGCAANSPQVQWDMLQEPLHWIRYHKASQLCACFWLRFLLCVCVCVWEKGVWHER